jgi:hypothetical protein
VRDRELGGRLHDHLEQRPRALELECQQTCALTGAQGVSRPDAEGRELRELRGIGLLPRGMEQLQHAERRPSQR